VQLATRLTQQVAEDSRRVEQSLRRGAAEPEQQSLLASRPHVAARERERRDSATLAGLLAGLMIFSWFWIVHLPRVRTSVSDGIALFEALMFSGIALVVAGALADESRDAVALRWRRDSMPSLRSADAHDAEWSES
jgi:hypothetical protein